MKNLNDDDIPSWAQAAPTKHKPYVPMSLVEKIAEGKEFNQDLSQQDAEKLLEERTMAYRLNESVLP